MKIHPIKMSWYQDRRAVEPRALQANYEPAMGALLFNDNQVTEAPNPRHSSLTAELIIVHLKFTTNSSAKLILISLLLTHFIFHMRWSVMWWKMRSRTRNFLALLQCKWSFYRRFNYTGAALKSTRSQKVSVKFPTTRFCSTERSFVALSLLDFSVYASQTLAGGWNSW